MASDKQNTFPLPESQVQNWQFAADENRYRETSVSMGVKQHRPLVSFENILPNAAVVTPGIVKSTMPSPSVGNQSVIK